MTTKTQPYPPRLWDNLLAKVPGQATGWLRRVKGSPIRDKFDADSLAFRIGVMLKEARKEANITQEQLAERTGTKKSYISRIEKGQSDIQISTYFYFDRLVLFCHIIHKLNYFQVLIIRYLIFCDKHFSIRRRRYGIVENVSTMVFLPSSG